MGTYENIEISTGKFTQEIEPDYWLREDTYWSLAVEWNDKADYTYEVENRRFFGYFSNLEVSIWHDKQKVADLLSEKISTSGFDTWRTKWVLDTAVLLPADASPRHSYQFTLLIKRGNIERKIIIHVSIVPKPLIPKLD